MEAVRTKLLVLAGLGGGTALRQSEEQLIMPDFPEGVIPA